MTRIKQSETCIRLPRRSKLSHQDERDAIQYLEMYLHGLWFYEKIKGKRSISLHKFDKILDVPVWAVVGNRCRVVNDHGQCNQPVYGDGTKC